MSTEATIARQPVVQSPNVQFIRHVYDALQRKDAAALAALSRPDIKVHQSNKLPWGGAYMGIEQAMLFFTRVVSYLDSNVHVERMLDAGDCIVTTGRTSGTAKKTGKAFDVPVVHVWKVEESKIVSLHVFLDNPSILPALQETGKRECKNDLKQ